MDSPSPPLTETQRSLLILCRHGNTFRSGEPTYMVGAHEDLPLTQEGEEQARRTGEALASLSLSEYTFLAAPLARTSRYAEILKEHVRPLLSVGAVSLSVDPRLTEIDYGAWSGRSQDEIAALPGGYELAAWDQEGVWPTSASFIPTQEQAQEDARALLRECRSRNCSVLVTSQGRLKVFAWILGTRRPYKVQTGRVCIVRYEAGTWSILGWNLPPGDIAESIAASAP